MRVSLVLIAVGVLSMSCVSKPAGDVALDLVQSINQGQVDRLVTQSAVPFLLDEELVNLSEDVAGFWQTLLKAGFKAGPVKVTRVSALDAEAKKLVGTGFEVQSFFSKYVDPKAKLVELTTDRGSKWYFIIKEASPNPTVYGFKGTY